MEKAELSVSMTEVVILTTKRFYAVPYCKVCDQIKFLGIELHRVLGFLTVHLVTAAARAQTTAQALTRLMANYTSLGHSVCDQAPICVPCLGLVRTVMVYRTLSTVAIMVVAGIILADQRVMEIDMSLIG